MKKGTVTMNIEKLRDLYENLKQTPHLEIGVFESKTARSDKGLTNAAIASFHEFGSPEHNLPRRSMLKVPIADHAAEVMAPLKGKAEAFLVTGTLKQLYNLVCIAALKVVDGAFQTGGYGKWPPLTYGTLLGKWKGSLKKRKGILGQIYAGLTGEGILIRTSQLRRAFSHRVRMDFH